MHKLWLDKAFAWDASQRTAGRAPQEMLLDIPYPYISRVVGWNAGDGQPRAIRRPGDFVDHALRKGGYR